MTTNIFVYKTVLTTAWTSKAKTFPAGTPVRIRPTSGAKLFVLRQDDEHKTFVDVLDAEELRSIISEKYYFCMLMVSP